MQKNSQIVIVEDDKDLCAGLCKALKDESRSLSHKRKHRF